MLSSYSSSDFDYDDYEDSIENYRFERQVENIKDRYRRKIEQRREQQDLRQRIMDYYDYDYDK